ncbi:TonB-dependent receptor [Pseudomonas aeruginosa]
MSDEWKLFANYPNRSAAASTSSSARGGAGNDTAAGLEPEKAKTYELGTRYDNGAMGRRDHAVLHRLRRRAAVRQQRRRLDQPRRHQAPGHRDFRPL